MAMIYEQINVKWSRKSWSLLDTTESLLWIRSQESSENMFDQFSTITIIVYFRKTMEPSRNDWSRSQLSLFFSLFRKPTATSQHLLRIRSYHYLSFIFWHWIRNPIQDIDEALERRLPLDEHFGCEIFDQMTTYSSWTWLDEEQELLCKHFNKI